MSPPYQAFTDSGLQAFYGASLQARGDEEPCVDCSDLSGNSYTLTFSGLGGDFAVFNGAHTVNPGGPWGECSWTKSLEAGEIAMYFGPVNPYDPHRWFVLVYTIWTCRKVWWAPESASQCDLASNAFGVYQCFNSGCDDADSCEDSAGATCVVS